MATLQTIRHINEARVLDALWRNGQMTRSDLGRELGLMRSTAGTLVASLARAGLVNDAIATDRDMGETRAGRPGSLIELNGDHAMFVGAEIAFGRVTVVGANLAGEPVCRAEREYDRANCDPEQVITVLAQCIEAIRDRTSTASYRGLAIAVAGPLSPDGVVVRAPYLGWRKVPLVRMVADRLSDFAEILAENDANAFAFAEIYRRDMSEPKDGVYLLIDAGVGGGIVANGQLIRGQHGFSGEIGHMPVGELGWLTKTDLPGSFESFVGIEALLAHYRDLGGEARTLADFHADLAEDREKARVSLEDWARYLGRALAILTAVLDPDHFVLGGGASSLIEPARTIIEAELRARIHDSQDVPAIVTSQLGREAPALGVARLMQHRFLSFDFEKLFAGTSAYRPTPPL